MINIQSAETLAGRIEIIEISGFALDEVGAAKRDRLWIRGGFPPSFLARNLPQMGLQLPAMIVRRLWAMVGHYHAQTWNASEIAASLGVSDMTARRYLDVLTGAPWGIRKTASYVSVPLRETMPMKTRQC